MTPPKVFNSSYWTGLDDDGWYCTSLSVRTSLQLGLIWCYSWSMGLWVFLNEWLYRVLLDLYFILFQRYIYMAVFNLLVA